MTDSASLLNEFSGGNPAGEEVRYEPVYDEIKDARRDDGDLPPELYDTSASPKRADWPRVAKLCEGLLAKRSKDLQVAAWLTEAWLHREGFAGLARGLDLTRELLERFWDHVFPELDGDDADFRAAPLNWVGSELSLPTRRVALSAGGHDHIAYSASLDVPEKEEADGDPAKAERRARAIEDKKTTPEEWAAGYRSTDKEWYRTRLAEVREARERLSALEATCMERFRPFCESDADVPLQSNSLARTLDQIQDTVAKLFAKKLETDPDPIDVTEGGGPAGLAETPRAGSVSVPSSGPPTSREDAAARIAAAARYLRDQDPTDPGPYLMLRGLRWGELRAGGGAVDPRLLAAPHTATRTHLKGLLLDGDWPQLLEAGEEVMATPFGRGWLDLQRYVLTAIDSLGGAYEPVGLGIRGALRQLLRDLPDLAEATLMDDTPTANRETRGWLRDTEVFGGFTDDAGAELSVRQSAPSVGVEPDGVLRLIARARAEAGAGRSERALRLLHERVGKESSERGRFLLRTEVAAVMADSGNESVALPVLKELYELTGTQQSLLDWEEPGTVARPLALLYRCCLLVGDTSVDTDELYLRVCRMDPMMAIELQTARPEASEPEPEASDG